MNTPKYILFHSTDEPSTLGDQLKSVNEYHKSQDFPISSLGYHVGYHVLITAGKKYICRADTDDGAHCNNVIDGQSMNFQSLAVCWGGDGDIEYPDFMSKALIKVQIKDWMRQHNIPIERVLYHRDFNKRKTCPGQLITRQWILDLLHEEDPSVFAQKEKLQSQITVLTRLVEALKKLLDLIKTKNV